MSTVAKDCVFKNSQVEELDLELIERLESKLVACNQLEQVVNFSRAQVGLFGYFGFF